jgi:hypothetical protein
MNLAGETWELGETVIPQRGEPNIHKGFQPFLLGNAHE